MGTQLKQRNDNDNDQDEQCPHSHTTTKRMSFGFDQESDEDVFNNARDEEERRRRSRRSTISLTDMQTALLRELDKYDRRSSILSLPPPPPTTTTTTTTAAAAAAAGNDENENDNKSTTTHSLTYTLPSKGLSNLIQEYDPDSQAMDIEDEESGLVENGGSHRFGGEEMQDEVNTTMDLQMMADKLREELERGDDSIEHPNGIGMLL